MRRKERGEKEKRRPLRDVFWKQISIKFKMSYKESGYPFNFIEMKIENSGRLINRRERKEKVLLIIRSY